MGDIIQRYFGVKIGRFLAKIGQNRGKFSSEKRVFLEGVLRGRGLAGI